METNENLKLTQLLRGLGAFALILSGAIFLFQGLNQWAGLDRFLGFGALVMSLGGLGVFCVKKLDETKGARTFLALCAAGVAVLFTTEGSMLVDIKQAHLNANLPKMLQTQIHSIKDVLIAGGLLALLGIPLSRFSFKVFSRRIEKSLFQMFALGGFFLLIPIRSDFALLMGIIGLTAFAGRLIYKLIIEDGLELTKEEVIALVITQIPPIIAIVRGAFHAKTALFPSAALMYVSLLLLITGFAKRPKELELDQEGRQVSKDEGYLTGSLILGLGSLASLSIHFIDITKFPEMINLMIVFIPAYLLTRVFSEIRFKKDNTLLRFLGVLASIIMVYTAFYNLNFINSFFLLIVGGALLVDGYKEKEIPIFYSGIGLLMASFLCGIFLAAKSLDIFHWLTFAILGGATILIASQIERKADHYKNKWLKVQNHFE